MYLYPPAYQRSEINDEKQQIVGKHTERSTCVRAHGIGGSTSNPWDIQVFERGIWDSNSHGKSTTNTNNPSKDLKAKSNTIAFKVSLYPLPNI